MKDKNYLILDSDSANVEYVIHIPADEDIYVLKRSVSETWSSNVRGETVLTLLNSGNGFKIKWEEKPEKNILDYSQAVQLTIMLNFVNQVSSMPSNYKIVNADDAIDIM
jgi:hypothetical protein